VSCLTKDIDSDYSDRDAVKRYMESKYGLNYVASVGTYGNLKIKNAIKDFSRLSFIQHSEANIITSIIDKDTESGDIFDLFKLSTKESKLKNFIQNNSEMISELEEVLMNPRNMSIHACATIIFPNDGVDLFHKIPVKDIDGQIVTAWEGKQLEKIGYLKADILGLKQLEKFKRIIDLIENNTGEKIDIYSIDLEDKKVYDLFSLGLTEDVFQFGTQGLKAFCKDLQPNSIEELSAANALYRPGAMESNAHTDFIDIKFGRKEPEYDYLLEDITKKTYGLYIYQEQVMQAFQKVTDSSLSEADTFRKLITKVKSLVDPQYKEYESIFIERYINKRQTELLAKKVWDKLIQFAKYGFNKSHAVSYAIIGYTAQWFKVNYPIEFWMTSLQEASDKERHNRISEIRKIGHISIIPPEINSSSTEFTLNKESNEIFWSLSSIKYVGEASVKKLINEREENGKFYSLEEFIKRLPAKSFNKRSITNLILSGAFDRVENIKTENERLLILDSYFHMINKPGELDQYLQYVDDLMYWQIAQFNLTGFGNINYKKALKRYSLDDIVDNIQEVPIDNYVSVSGLVKEVNIRKSKNGEFATIKLDCNSENINVVIWSQIFELYREEILSSEDKVLILNGQVKNDNYNNCHSLYSTQTSKIIII